MSCHVMSCHVMCTQLLPRLEPEVLKHCRWSSRKTFTTSYKLPVDLLTEDEVDDTATTTISSLLRHGIHLKPPGTLTRREFYQPPDQWVGQTTSFGKIVSFNKGVYTVRRARGSDIEYYHQDLMATISNI